MNTAYKVQAKNLKCNQTDDVKCDSGILQGEIYFLPLCVLYTHFIKERPLVTVSFQQPLHQPLLCSILLLYSKCKLAKAVEL